MADEQLESEVARSVERAGIYQLMRTLPLPLKLTATAVAIGVLYWLRH